MKKFLGLFGVIFVAGPALGADMSVRGGAPWAVPSWTGCYGGINLGGVTGGVKDRWTNITETPAAAAAPGASTATVGFAVDRKSVV